MRIMVMAIDPNGCPRCWGIADNPIDAKNQCILELSEYQKEKRELGDFDLGRAQFTFKTKEVE